MQGGTRHLTPSLKRLVGGMFSRPGMFKYSSPKQRELVSGSYLLYPASGQPAHKAHSHPQQRTHNIHQSFCFLQLNHGVPSHIYRLHQHN
uniref:Uncharacterized protein n=1 Tax=Medicago truncatula TaxID=3880 RepID=I3S888_MEDTR|nr:unknown [Medicago truncatula]